MNDKGTRFETMPKLPIQTLSFKYQTLSDGILPWFTGALWRGALLIHFKHLVCVTKQLDCVGCAWHQHCSYANLFEPLETQTSKDYPKSPPKRITQPYSLNADAGGHFVSKNQTIGFNITLIGSKISNVTQQLIAACSQIQSIGVYPNYLSISLQRVLDNTDKNNSRIIFDHRRQAKDIIDETIAIPQMPNTPKRAIIQLITPLRLVTWNKPILKSEQLTPKEFFIHLERRVHQVSKLYCLPQQNNNNEANNQFPIIDFEQLYTAKWQSQSLQVKNANRYSTRQKRKHPLTGFVGSLELEHELLEVLWPYLWLGQWIQFGKATGMGLGYYQVSS